MAGLSMCRDAAAGQAGQMRTWASSPKMRHNLFSEKPQGYFFPTIIGNEDKQGDSLFDILTNSVHYGRRGSDEARCVHAEPRIWIAALGGGPCIGHLTLIVDEDQNRLERLTNR